MPERKGYDRQVRYGRTLGLFFCVAGFTAIAFAWNGSAKTAFVDVQFPYLISGGIGGLALVLLGVGLLVMAQIRAERIQSTSQLEQMSSILSRVAGAARSHSADGQVVAGKSTYHRPGCRLVKGKRDVDYISVEVANLNGLTPCRVCKPSDLGLSAEKTASAAEHPTDS